MDSAAHKLLHWLPFCGQPTASFQGTTQLFGKGQSQSLTGSFVFELTFINSKCPFKRFEAEENPTSVFFCHFTKTYLGAKVKASRGNPWHFPSTDLTDKLCSGRIKDYLLYFFITLFFCYRIHKSIVAQCNMYHHATPADASARLPCLCSQE